MAAVDMPLDNMIQNNRRNSVRSGGRGRGVRHPGGTFRSAGRLAGTPHRGPLGMHSIAKAMCRTSHYPWQNSVLGDRLKPVGSSGMESRTKLQVSNLNAGVSNEDIRKLFSEIGELVRYGIHYDKNGTPCGSAEVVFARREDSFQAVKRYNNAQLDGNPMKIENVRSIARAQLDGNPMKIENVRSKARAHVASRLNIIAGPNGRRTVHMTPGIGYMRNRPGPGYMRNRPGAGYKRNAAVLNHDVGPSYQRSRGGWNVGVAVHGSRGRGRGRRHSGLGRRTVEKSAEELDKELENYQAETTQTV